MRGWSAVVIGDAFSSIRHAIDLVPASRGLVGGLFYGLAFGLAACAAGLGVLADHIGHHCGVQDRRLAPALGLRTSCSPSTTDAVGVRTTSSAREPSFVPSVGG
jgi:hypothetical protein